MDTQILESKPQTHFFLFGYSNLTLVPPRYPHHPVAVSKGHVRHQGIDRAVRHGLEVAAILLSFKQTVKQTTVTGESGKSLVVQKYLKMYCEKKEMKLKETFEQKKLGVFLSSLDRWSKIFVCCNKFGGFSLF